MNARNMLNVTSPCGGVAYFQGLVTSTNAFYMLPRSEKWPEIGGKGVKMYANCCLSPKMSLPFQGLLASTDALCILFHRE